MTRDETLRLIERVERLAMLRYRVPAAHEELWNAIPALARALREAWTEIDKLKREK